jgi:hypothetical protein
MAVLQQFAKFKEADAIALVANVYFRRNESIRDLPPSEQGEALVACLRIRAEDETWARALAYEPGGQQDHLG